MRIAVSCKISIILFIMSLSLNACTPSEKYLRSKNLSQPDQQDNSTQNNPGKDNPTKDNPGKNNPIYVKILIDIKDKNFKVTSVAGLRVINKNDSKIIYESEKAGLSFDPSKIKSTYVIESDKNILNIDNTGYRGKFELHNVQGKIHVVNILTIEEYLYSVVPSEMPATWNMEALKAQAIASRTYAYHFLIRKDKDKNIYDLDSTTNFQVYKGISVETESSIEAVNSTCGIIMTFNNEPIISYFHSTSGGKTSDGKDVWSGADHSYLKSVECNYGKDSPHSEWTTTLSMDEITQALNKKYNMIDTITKISFKRHNDRIVEVTVQHKNGTTVLSGNEFRLLLNPQRLKSTYFTLKKEKDVFYLNGKGWGHGVGMCQWGARGRGDNGLKYEEILRHYYQGINFTKIDDNYVAQK